MISNINQNHGGKNEAASAKNFDEEKFYTEEILPLMKLIEAKCESHRIPYLVHVNFSLVDSDTEEVAGVGTMMNTCGRGNGVATRMRIAGGIASGKILPSDLVKASLAAAAAAASKTVKGWPMHHDWENDTMERGDEIDVVAAYEAVHGKKEV